MAKVHKMRNTNDFSEVTWSLKFHDNPELCGFVDLIDWFDKILSYQI